MGRRMEPANVAPEPLRRRAGPLREIFGKLGVIGGGERPLALQAPAPRRETKRSLRSDMDGVGRRRRDPLADPLFARQGEADGGIGRAWHRRELIGRSEEHTSELQSLMRSSYAV